MIDVTKFQVRTSPFPHVISEEFLDPDLYARLRAEYPHSAEFDESGGVGQRSGRDIYRGDDAMDRLLAESDAWRSFHDYLNSAAFLGDTVELFGPTLSDAGFRLRPDDLTFAEWTEPRGDLVQGRVKRKIAATTRRLRGNVRPEDLYCRLDVHQGGTDYAKRVHCDLPNRLVSMIVYFADADEIDCDGGDLVIHAHTERKAMSDYERYPDPDKTVPVDTLRPRENLGVFFACSNNSYHSVTQIKSLSGYRDFVYINLSSRSDDIWR